MINPFFRANRGPLRCLRQGALPTAGPGLCGQADDAAADGEAPWRSGGFQSGSHTWIDFMEAMPLEMEDHSTGKIGLQKTKNILYIESSGEDEHFNEMGIFVEFFSIHILS